MQKWWPITTVYEMPSGKFKLRLYSRRSDTLWFGVETHYYLSFSRVTEKRADDPLGDMEQVIAIVRLKFNFGHPLYCFSLDQIHAHEDAKNRFSVAVAIKEIESL